MGQDGPDMQIRETRRALPIFPARKTLCAAIAKSPVTIIVGETGSGKTTQIPQYLVRYKLASPAQMVAVTQPRRVAAVSVAARVAQEMECAVGTKVGYSVRFEAQVSRETAIKYMTDGMLLREAISDPLLLRYGVILLDEAHERTVRTDVLLGMVKALLRQRNDPESPHPRLRLVVMSATLNAAKFSAFFNNAPVLYVSGRLHPIQVRYTLIPQTDYVDSALRTIFQIHLGEAPGDVLVFLTGQDEIESLLLLVKELSRELPPEADKLLPVPLYANLPLQEQTRPFDPAPKGTRKIVLATNIAETSVTIPNIRYVVDTGVVKVKAMFARTGLCSLTVREISRAMARQRMGRAGRDGPGVCFRLYTEAAFDSLPEELEPELQRSPLASVVLQLKASGIDDIVGFDFIDRPSEQSLVRALEQLYGLGAVGPSGQLTESGRQMSRMPLDPVYSKMILAACASDRACLYEIVALVAMLSTEGSIWRTARSNGSGDAGADDMRQVTLQRKRVFGNVGLLGRVSGSGQRGNGLQEGDGFTPLGDHLLLLNVLCELERVAEEYRRSVASGSQASAVAPTVEFEDGDEEEAPQDSASADAQGLRKHLSGWCTANHLSYAALKQALLIRAQLIELLVELKMATAETFARPSPENAFPGAAPLHERVLQCVFSGLFQNVAILNPDGSYRTLVGQQTVYMHPSCLLFAASSLHTGTSRAARGAPKIVVYNELVHTSRRYMRTVSCIRAPWLQSCSPVYFGSSGTGSLPGLVE